MSQDVVGTVTQEIVTLAESIKVQPRVCVFQARFQASKNPKKDVTSITSLGSGT
jgi:hypothetical protein